MAAHHRPVSLAAAAKLRRLFVTVPRATGTLLLNDFLRRAPDLAAAFGFMRTLLLATIVAGGVGRDS